VAREFLPERLHLRAVSMFVLVFVLEIQKNEHEDDDEDENSPDLHVQTKGFYKAKRFRFCERNFYEEIRKGGIQEKRLILLIGGFV
jgi:hypothetical protein